MSKSVKSGRNLSLVLSVLFQFTLVPSTFSQQYDASLCEKYCFTSCTPGHDFSTCIGANTDCSCNRLISIKNPLVIILTVFLVLIGLFVAVYCYRCSRGGRAPLSNRVLVEPIVSTINVPLQQQRGTFHCHCCCHSPHSGHNVRTSQSGFALVEQPAGSSSYNIPSEYSSPPPYNECVANQNQTKYWRNPNPTLNATA